MTSTNSDAWIHSGPGTAGGPGPWAWVAAVHAIFISLAVPSYLYKFELFRMVNQDRGPFWDMVMDTATHLCDGYVWTFAFLLLLPVNGKRAVTGLKAMILLMVGVWVLKQIFYAPRPLSVLEGVRVVGRELRQGSFPSGHTATIFAAVTLLYYWIGRRAAPLFAVAAFCGLSRVYVGAHFPLDVVGGAYLGIGIAWAASRIPGPGRAVEQFFFNHRRGWTVFLCAALVVTAVHMRLFYPMTKTSPYFYTVLMLFVLAGTALLMKREFRRAPAD